MQLICTRHDFYVKGVGSVLKCSRKDAKLSLSSHAVLADIEALNVLGEVACFFGKLATDEGPFLLFVTQTSTVGELGRSGASVQRVNKVVAVPVADDGSMTFSCLDNEPNGLEKLKTKQKRLLHFVTNRGSISNKVVDEVLKLINDSGSFYYSDSLDLTLSSQRLIKNPDKSCAEFFWNKRLLLDLLDEDFNVLPGCSEWVVRVVHGYFEQRFLSYETESQLRLTLVSRRSTHRAGCRYLKRGVDDEGHVANFVETEMMVDIFGHTLSFVQARGSIPIFWSQKGYRYRPPLSIDKPLTDSLPAFRAHLEQLKAVYGCPLSVVSLVDHTGREFALGEAFLQHVLELDDPDIAYYSFDFHDHCRALKFDNVSILLNALEPTLAKIGFCWIDKSGQMVREQKGILRTNCVDCLDRTNVVQSAVSQNVCAGQAMKLGLIEPFAQTPEILVQLLQGMWADHGDFISRQYAGTDALKGDITRGGQRKLVGLVKDGYNSASRYYLSHVKDAQRQRAIDALTAGTGRSMDFLASPLELGEEAKPEGEEEDEEAAKESEEEVENIGRMVHETARFILPEDEVLVGGWALVDGANPAVQVDTVLLLTRSQIFVAYYADDSEKLLDLKRIVFADVSLLELGTLGRSPRVHLRLHWRTAAGAQYGTWRAAKTRLFNNVAIALKDSTEADEYIQAIAEQLRITLQMCDHPVQLSRVPALTGSACSSRPRGRGSFMAALGSKLKLPAARRPPKTTAGSLAAPSSMSQSKSDGLLSQAALTSTSLIGRFQDKLRTPFTRSHVQVFEGASPPAEEDAAAAQEAASLAPRRDYFEAYKQGILKSKSLIMML